MKTTLVTVRFPEGLHARPAATLARLVRKFRARVLLRRGNRFAHAGSVLGILLLAAALNDQIEVQASGDDEDAAIQAAAVFFQMADDDSLPYVTSEASPN
jgi:phosphocarrier protein HPr